MKGYTFNKVYVDLSTNAFRKPKTLWSFAAIGLKKDYDSNFQKFFANNNVTNLLLTTQIEVVDKSQSQGLK